MGMFLDPMAILLVSVPILLPAVLGLGVNPIVFGVLAVVALEIALITPPYGLTLFSASGFLREPFHEIARGTFMFYPAMIVGIILIAYVPNLSLFLPRLLNLPL